MDLEKYVERAFAQYQSRLDMTQGNCLYADPVTHKPCDKCTACKERAGWRLYAGTARNILQMRLLEREVLPIVPIPEGMVPGAKEVDMRLADFILMYFADPPKCRACAEDCFRHAAFTINSH